MSKIETIKSNWSEIIDRLRSDKQELAQFLRFSAGMYKQSFSDAALIYHQNPNATKVATLKTWNKLGRLVNKGEHSIAVFGEDSRAKHLFDISQTNGKRIPELWKLTEDLSSELTVAINKKYGKGCKDIRETIAAMSVDNIRSHLSEMMYATGQMKLTDNDLKTYQQSVVSAVRFMVSTRCELGSDMKISSGINLNAADFFKEKRDLVRFCTIVQKSAKDTLLEMEREIVQIMKQRREINELQTKSDRTVSSRSGVHGGKQRTEAPAKADRSVGQNVAGVGQNRVSNRGADLHYGGSMADNSEGNRPVGGEPLSGTGRAVPSGKSPSADVRGNTVVGENAAVDGGTRDNGGNNFSVEELIERYKNADFNRRLDSCEIAGRMLWEADYNEFKGGAVAFFERFEADKFSKTQANEIRNIIKSALESREKSHDFIEVSVPDEPSQNEPVILNNEIVETSDLPPFLNEKYIAEILTNDRFFKIKRDKVAEFFENTPDVEKRAEFMKKVFNADYTELDFDDTRLGYKADISGVLMWEGNFLSRTSEAVFSWDLVQSLTADLIEKGEYLDKEITDEPVFAEPEVKEFPEPEPVQQVEQLSFFGDTEPVPAAEPAKKVSQRPVAISRTAPDDEMIDYILKCGSNEPKSLERIVAQFQKEKSTAENAEFLRKEFGEDGRGYKFTSHDFTHSALLAAWFDNSGITAAISNTAFPQGEKIHLSWEQVSEKISSLLNMGEYCSQDIIDRAAELELKDVANELWYIHQDLSDDNRDNFFIPKDFFAGGFPDSTERIKISMTDENTLQKYIDGLSDFIVRYEENRNIMRYHFHNLKETLQRLNDLKIPRKEFIANADFKFEPNFFITEDEKDRLLTMGGNIAGGKFRIEKFFKAEHTAKEKADFVKNEYGTGGSGRSGYFTFHDSKGLRFKKDALSENDCEIHMNWNEIAKRIDVLIAEDKYITQSEIDEYIRDAKRTVENHKIESDYDKAVVEHAKKILAEYGADVDKSPVEKIIERAEAAGIPVETVSEEKAVFMDVRDETFIAVQQVDEGIEYSVYSSDLTVIDGGIWEMDEGMDLKSAAADLLATMEKIIVDVPDYDNFIELTDTNSERNISSELAKIKADIYSKIPSKNNNISAKKTEKNISENNKNNSVSAVNSPEKITVPEIKEPKSGVPVTYHFSPENVAAGGAKSRFNSNIEAIKTLHKIEAENRFATSEEQAVMAKYVGWGGIQQAFVSDKVAENISGNLGEAAPSEWENEQKELLELLSPDEYKAARASTLTSFYTPPDVADGIYQALSQFGFEGGNVLEPSMGVGNFFAKMPEDMRDNSKLYGVELDSISGRIAQQLYPNERIQIKGFEQTNFNNNSFDVVVGNIPFGDYRVSDKKYDKYNFKIHDYFAAKAVDKVKPNGVVALVTSKFTMDKLNESLITNASISETGSYEIVCTVNDGENTVIAKETIDPADSYADIDPDKQEASAPEISVDLPQYADRKQVINAKIENLNNTEISWYSVIFNKNTPVTVDDDGSFTLTMPNKDGKFPVVVRAFDWSGKSDVKEYEIIVDSSAPTVSVTASSENVSIGDEAYFTVNITLENKIASTEYTLNGEAVTVADGRYILDTTAAGTYTFTANAVTTAGKTITASAEITVEDNSETDTEAPTVELTFDKDAYSVGDTITAEITATDNIGVTKLEAFVNDAETEIDENNRIKVENAAEGEYVFTVNAYDEAGNMGTATHTINIVLVDTEAPTVELTFDKDAYSVGDTITAEIIATDNIGVTKLEAFVNDAETVIDENNRIKVENAAEGEYVFTVNAYDEAGNMGTAAYTITIVSVDTEAPTVTITFDKDTYLERDDIIFTVAAEDNIGVTKTVVTVDGTEIAPDADGNYSIKNAELKTYGITASAYDEAGNIGTATASVPVNEASAPVITVVFDKESYSEGDDLSALITAEGQREIKEIKVLVNGEEKTLEEGGVLKIESIAAGEYVFNITAEDVKGFTSECEKTVTVLPIDTEDKRLTAEIEPFVEYGETALLTVKITDEINAESLKVVLDDEEISLTSELTYEFKAEELFAHNFVITAQTNDGETIEKEASVYVKDSVCPTMTITYDKPDGYYEGEDIVATIVAEDNVGIKRIEYTYDGVEYPIDENGQVTIPKIHVDTHAVVATAWDTFGNSITLTSTFIVVYDDVSGEDVIKTEDDIDSAELVCKIYTPKDGQTVTAPISIVGTAAGTEFKNYKLEYAPVGSKNYTLIKEGTEAVNANILGKLDPTLMNNGLYNLKLTVYSEKKNVSSEIVVSVEGNMKIGNFSIAFQDMDVNVAGLPLTVIRSYDSRSRNTKGDFGYGWDMSTSGVKINESCDMSANWDMNMDPVGWGYYQYSVTGKRAHIVTINYGNGKTEKFELEVVLPSPMSRPQYGVTLKFKPLNGSKSSLEIIGASTGNLFYDSGWIGSLSQLDVFRYTSYRLTKQDGTVYIINRNGTVESITEPNGSKITFTKDGIIHSDGKSIVFNRDKEGRITSIASPTGKTVTYTYDENGDLASMTDVSGEVTRFVYENHYLTEIIDPRGVRVSKNIYDDDGRLIKTIDADGNEIKYDHDINGREERVTDRNGNVTRYVYDQNGNILSQTDPNGNTIKNTYDSNGNLSSKTDAMGNVTNYKYDNASGDLLTYNDAEGHTVTNTYNSKGQITSINAMGINTISLQYNEKGKLASTTDALGNDINYSYDSKGQLTSVTDEIGTYMNMTYDSDGNVVSAVNAAGTSYQFTYDADGNNTSKTMTYTSDGVMKTVTEQYFYDAAGNLTKIIDSDGNVTTTDYNSMGKVSSATDEKGRTTTYDYDDFGNLIGISYPDGTSERFTYDREGNNLTATDRMGRTVTMTYDKVGNLLSKTYPNGARVSYSYDANYNLVSETSAGGGVTYYEYDKIGRNTAITDALGNRTAFSYNAKSQLESMTDPMGRTYTYSYDDNGNRIRTAYPDGTSVSTEYDSRGRITRQTDQNGYSTRYTLDASDNLTRVTNAQGVSTSYAYDELGNMTSITDGNGNVTSLAYDDYGRVIRTTNALGNSSYITYDESGNVLTSTDYAGNVTTYTYDNFDRVLSKTNNDGTVSYTYTTDGKLSSVTDNSGVTMFTYDNMDGLTRVDYPDGSYVAYDYDSACRLTSVTTPFGTTSYEYDMLDRLTRVVDRNGYATIYEYDANGNRTAVRYANGYTTAYDYDLLNRLVRQETLDNDGEVVVQYIYTLGAAGERLSVAELGRTVEYTYDNLYRLTGETITEGENVTAYTYSYDNVGNRILKTKNGAETVYTYNELNQLVADSDNTYEYDLNGNLVRVIGGAQAALYEYNSENKLVKATVQQGVNVVEETYTYDYAGNRTSKTTSTSDGNFEVVKYLNDTNSDLTNVLVEFDENGAETCFYTLGADLISQERNSRTYTYLYDGHGSVVGLMSEDGSVTDTYTYDAFGNLLKSTGRTENNYRYCGEQFDSTTGLYYLRARYMDTSTGRFISQDSYQGNNYDPITLHKYLYANSNPITYSDPSGYFAGAVTCIAIDVAYIKMFLALTAMIYASVAIGYSLYSIAASYQHYADGLASGSIDSATVNTATKSQASDLDKTKKKKKRSGFIKYGPLDEVGRATEAFGIITQDMLSDGTPAMSSLKPVGFVSGKGLDRGHLIAKMLGGSGSTLQNLTPIYHRVNNGIMKHYEYVIRAAIYVNESVFVEVMPFYSGNDGVPMFIEMTAFSLNGVFELSVPIINRR